MNVDWLEAADGFQESRTRAGDTQKKSDNASSSTTSVSNTGNSKHTISHRKPVN